MSERRKVRCGGRDWRYNPKRVEWHPGETEWLSGGSRWTAKLYTVTSDNHGWHWRVECYPRRILENGLEQTRRLAMLAAIRAARGRGDSQREGTR
jgi:hypothetical protein